jgi:hypothetical protein
MLSLAHCMLYIVIEAAAKRMLKQGVNRVTKITLAVALILALNAIGLSGCSIHRNYYGAPRWHHWK